jgi:hypothetical protein
MAEGQTIEAEAAPNLYWWSEAWKGSRKRIIIISTEFIVSSGLGISLALFFLLIRLFRLAGLPADTCAFIEGVDAFAIKAVFIAFAILFVIDAFAGVWERFKSFKHSLNETD